MRFQVLFLGLIFAELNRVVYKIVSLRLLVVSRNIGMKVLLIFMYSTAIMASNLGYQKAVVSPACFARASADLGNVVLAQLACADAQKNDILWKCLRKVEAFSNGTNEERKMIAAIACSGGSEVNNLMTCLQKAEALLEGAENVRSLNAAIACSGDSKSSDIQQCLLRAQSDSRGETPEINSRNMAFACTGNTQKNQIQHCEMNSMNCYELDSRFDLIRKILP
jgi:hypothetical protein